MLQNVLLAEWISSWHPLMPLKWNLLLILSSTHTIAFANLTKPSRTNSAALCCVQLCLFLKLSSIRHDWVQLSFSLLHGLLYGYVHTHTHTHTNICVCVCVIFNFPHPNRLHRSNLSAVFSRWIKAFATTNVGFYMGDVLFLWDMAFACGWLMIPFNAL